MKMIKGSMYNFLYSRWLWHTKGHHRLYKPLGASQRRQFLEKRRQFDPYRYLTEEGKMDSKPESWLPFSAGRRVCLGEPVARTELLLITTNLLQNFHFKAPPGVDFVPEVVSTSEGQERPKDYKVVVERRK